MIVTYKLSNNHKCTQAELDEIERAKNSPIIIDEDCPELTEDFLKNLKRIEHPINYFS